MPSSRKSKGRMPSPPGRSIMMTWCLAAQMRTLSLGAEPGWGELFERKEYFLPEVLYSARAMKAALQVLHPLLVKSGFKSMGKVVLGTVEGDLHDIGKNVVKITLEGAGFEASGARPVSVDAAVREGTRTFWWS
jgi:hypothetical protein